MAKKTMTVSVKMKSSAAFTAKNLSVEISKLEKCYGGTDKLVGALRYAPGFGRVNRSSIWRWKNATQEGVSVDLETASDAVEFLQAHQNDVTLKLALGQSLQVLPAMIVLWDDVPNSELRVKRDSPYGRLLQLGVKTRVEWFDGGFKALTALCDEKAGFDVAFAASDFDPKNPDDDVQALCQVTEARWSVIGRGGPIQSVMELEEKRVGCHPDTAMNLKLRQIMDELGVTFTPVSDKDSKNLARALESEPGSAKHIDFVVGWEPLLSQIKDFFASHEKQIVESAVHQSELKRYAVRVQLFARKTANPAAVRLLLDALEEANEYVSDARNAEEIARVCVDKFGREWGLKRSAVLETLNPHHTNYELKEFNHRIARHLWRCEVERSKVSKG
jgi:hypothetical protein